MTKRERVLRTVRFEETDRVPLYDILQNDAIIGHFARRESRYEDGAHTTALAVGAMLDMTRMVGGPSRDETVRRDDGVTIQMERWTSWVVERPFEDIESLVPWVKERIRETEALTFGPRDAERFRNEVETKWAAFAEGDPTGRDDPAVLVHESGVGLTEMYSTPGMELFTLLMFEYPDLLEEWLEARNQAELRRVAVIADPVYVPIALTYDDIAHKTGTLFSPDWLRRCWIPKLKRLTDAWHERGVYCLFHSDGNLWGIMDDLVLAGIDGLNPLEVLADMTVAKTRTAYPDLFLAGGIDVSQLLTFGSPDEVRAVCKQAIADTGARGFFMGSSTELHWDVPLENAVAMAETAWETAN